MPNRRAVPAAALTVVALAGCGSSGTDAAGRSPSATDPTSAGTPAQTSMSPPSTSTSAGPTGGASSGTAAGAPGVPEPARQHTTKGAIAFAKYYINLLNITGRKPDVNKLQVLSLDGCKSCRNYERNVKSLAANSEHNDGKEIRYHSAKRVLGKPGYIINALIDQMEMNVISKDGSIAHSYPEIRNVGLVFDLKWTKNGWRIKTIKVDKSRMQ